MEDINILPPRIGFFQESEGVWSMMRLCLFITTVSMIALAFVVELLGEWNVYNSSLIGGALGFMTWMKQRQQKNEK